MAERRSSRCRKPMKYSDFGDGSDDDFADTTPPPPKKVRNTKSVEENVKVLVERAPKSSPISQQTLKERKTKGRRSVSDKILDRDLEEALQLSLLETGGTQNCSDPPVLSISASCNQDPPDRGTDLPPFLSPIKADSTLDPIPACDFPITSTAISSLDTSDKPSSEKEGSHPNGTAPSNFGVTTVLDDSIEEIEAPATKGRNQTRQRQVRKKPAVVESDSDETDESEEDDVSEPSGDDSDSDYDFDEKPKGKGKPVKGKVSPSEKTKASKPSAAKGTKSQKQASKSNPTTEPRKSCPLVKPVSNVRQTTKSIPSGASKSSPLVSAQPSTSVPSRSTSGHSVVSPALKQQWKPPERVGPGASSSPSLLLKSPMSGLRLGLSRNHSVKPLHPSLGVK